MTSSEKVRITPRRFTYLGDEEKERLMRELYPGCEVIDTEYGHLYVVGGKKKKQ